VGHSSPSKPVTELYLVELQGDLLIRRLCCMLLPIGAGGKCGGSRTVPSFLPHHEGRGILTAAVGESPLPH
jgi:hypothetical protein